MAYTAAPDVRVEAGVATSEPVGGSAKPEIGFRPQPPHLVALLVLVAVALFAIVLSGAPVLADNEGRIATYVADAFQNGDWIFPGAGANVASKPPMLTWLVALSSMPFDGLNRFALYFPSALATLLVALLLLRVGRSVFGWEAGFLAAVIYLLSAVSDIQMNTSRYDGLFTLPTALAAVAAFQAWTLGRKWAWFWLAAAVATLVKGPLGPVIAAGGLFAAWWEKRSGTPLPIRGSHWAGIGIFLVICGGWFALAYHQMGQSMIDKLIGSELVGHAIGAKSKHLPFERLDQPFRNFLEIFAPWSAIACVAFWRLWRRPSADALGRRFERFLFCWFLFALLIFSVAAHQHTRLIFPLIPPAALLAGRQLATWLRAWPPLRIRSAALVASVLFLLGCAAWHHLFLKDTRSARHAMRMRALAQQLHQELGSSWPINFINVPFEFRFYLNNASAPVSLDQAANLLASNVPAVVAVTNLTALRQALGPDIILHDLIEKNGTNLRVVSNVAHPSKTNRLRFMAGGLLLETENATLSCRTREKLLFTGRAPGANVAISNTTSRGRQVTVSFNGLGARQRQHCVLAPSSVWRCEAGGAR